MVAQFPQKLRPALLSAMLLIAVCTAIVVGDGRCDRPTAGVAIFGSSPSKIIGRDAVLDPPPPNPKQDLRLMVSSTVSYDTTTRLYTYTYAVENQQQSGNALDTWGIAPVRDPVGIDSPAHWAAANRWEERRDAIVWTVVDDVGVPDTTKNLDLHLSPHCPQPGTTTTGFRFTSRQPPTTVNYYAQGFDTLLDVAEDEGEILPSAQTLFTNGVTGTTLGPDINSLVSVGDGPAAHTRGIEFRSPAPNPAIHDVAISYYLPNPAKVQLTLHDVSGRRIRVLADGERPAGLHSVSWNGFDDDGRRLKAGVYFSRLIVNGKKVGQQKMTILK